MTTALLTMLGVSLLAVALRDIFHTLWHPRGLGTISRRTFRAVWRVTRVWNRREGRSTELAGPLGLLMTVLVWTALVVLGWALIYWPRMPGGFYYGTSVSPDRSADFLAAVYLSLVAVATLGFGDIVPSDDVLRLLLPVQALVGFVLLTAAISWILQVYPVLERRRKLARQLSMMADTDTLTIVRTGHRSVACSLINGVTDGITAAEVDLMQYGESYFFRSAEPSHSLPAAMPFVMRLAQAAAAAKAPEVRHAGRMLDLATDSLAITLNNGYLNTDGDTAEVIEAFVVDHQQPAGAARRQPHR
ncbi:MAG: potassium channel family protein [Ornithinimicrobium sp.]